MYRVVTLAGQVQKAVRETSKLDTRTAKGLAERRQRSTKAIRKSVRRLNTRIKKAPGPLASGAL
jgi:hypothetical protein